MNLPKMFVLAAAIVAPGAALAQGGAVRTACQGDIQTLCGPIQPGGGHIRDCLREHRAELSATCKVAIADRMLERKTQRTNEGPPAAGVTTAPSK